jgi:hypothetical protein
MWAIKINFLQDLEGRQEFSIPLMDLNILVERITNVIFRFIVPFQIEKIRFQRKKRLR